MCRETRSPFFMPIPNQTKLRTPAKKEARLRDGVRLLLKLFIRILSQQRSASVFDIHQPAICHELIRNTSVCNQHLRECELQSESNAR